MYIVAGVCQLPSTDGDHIQFNCKDLLIVNCEIFLSLARCTEINLCIFHTGVIGAIRLGLPQHKDVSDTITLASL